MTRVLQYVWLETILEPETTEYLAGGAGRLDPVIGLQFFSNAWINMGILRTFRRVEGCRPIAFSGVLTSHNGVCSIKSHQASRNNFQVQSDSEELDIDKRSKILELDLLYDLRFTSNHFCLPTSPLRRTTSIFLT
jgi:hypothetical protein